MSTMGMILRRFDSVWDAIEDTPEEAEKMKLQSALRMLNKERQMKSVWVIERQNAVNEWNPCAFENSRDTARETKRKMYSRFNGQALRIRRYEYVEGSRE